MVGIENHNILTGKVTARVAIDDDVRQHQFSHRIMSDQMESTDDLHERMKHGSSMRIEMRFTLSSSSTVLSYSLNGYADAVNDLIAKCRPSD